MKCELVCGSRMLQDTLLQTLVLDPTDAYAMHIQGMGPFTHPYILIAWNRSYTHSFLFTYRQQAISMTISPPQSWNHNFWCSLTMRNRHKWCTENKNLRSARGNTGGRAASFNGILLRVWSRVPKGLQGTTILFLGHSDGEAWHTWASKEQTKTIQNFY